MSKIVNNFLWGRPETKVIKPKTIVAGLNISVTDLPSDIVIATKSDIILDIVRFNQAIQLADSTGIINVRDLSNLVIELVTELSKYKPWKYIGVWVEGTIAQKNNVYSYGDGLYLSLKDDNLETPSDDKINWLLLDLNSPIDLSNYYTKQEIDAKFSYYENQIIESINVYLARYLGKMYVKRFSKSQTAEFIDANGFLEMIDKCVTKDGNKPVVGVNFEYFLPNLFVRTFDTDETESMVGGSDKIKQSDLPNINLKHKHSAYVSGDGGGRWKGLSGSPANQYAGWNSDWVGETNLFINGNVPQTDFIPSYVSVLKVEFLTDIYELVDTIVYPEPIDQLTTDVNTLRNDLGDLGNVVNENTNNITKLKTELKSIVAESVDFADFKIKIGGW